MKYRVGVDIGGTFTDLYAYDTDSKKTISLSTPSTPENFADGVLNLIDKAKIKYEDIALIVHGTTVATNAIITKNYEEIAFVTTKGMRDLVEIGRFHRKELYNPYQKKPDPIVTRNNRYTVTERIDKDGQIIEQLDEAEVREVAEVIKSKGIKSVCVGFLNSHRNATHEVRAAEIISEVIPGSYVAASAMVLPAIGALGRFTTGIINASLYHRINRYISSLEERLTQKGFNGKLLLVQSNGGSTTSEMIRRKPENLLMSGPAGGVIGALAVHKLSGQKDIITYDMGGTSTDISIVEKGVPSYSTEFKIEWDMPVPIPLIDITSIGAGGGSIGWKDSGGVLKVGPQSAGARPGPVCYGFGGAEPTVCDANLVLGYLDAEEFLDGEMKLDVEAAKIAIEKLGKSLGLDMIKTAEGILEIVNENMSNAIKEITIGKGRDPRDFVLSAFGGAGSLHAVAVAEKVGIPTVVIPPDPGNLCALGDINMNLHNEVERFFYVKMADVDIATLSDEFSEMDKEGLNLLRSQNIKTKGETVKHTLSIRYVGQSYEIEIPCDEKVITNSVISDLTGAFHAAHKKLYSVNDPESELEITKLRATIIGDIAEDVQLEKAESDEQKAHEKTTKAFFNGAYIDTPVYQRHNLTPNKEFVGPLIIREKKSSTIIPPGKACVVDPSNYSIIIKNVE